MSVAEISQLTIDIGISESDRHALADQLSHLLADTQRLYQKTHAYHWNVTGPMFQTLHVMFEQHYNELWLAQDVIAERIRALGFFAPGSTSQFDKLTEIPEDEGVPTATEMLRNLVDGHQATARTARKVLKTAEAASDAPTADLMTERLQIHEKTAWMLRSLLA
jgi:starvation-inducible DNA-binding protein